MNLRDALREPGSFDAQKAIHEASRHRIYPRLRRVLRESYPNLAPRDAAVHICAETFRSCGPLVVRVGLTDEELEGWARRVIDLVLGYTHSEPRPLPTVPWDELTQYGHDPRTLEKLEARETFEAMHEVGTPEDRELLEAGLYASSWAEVGEVLGMPPARVRKRAQRLRERHR